MADNEKYTLEQLLTAIRGSAGIKATVMRNLGCSRNTVDNYLKRYATAQQAYDDEIESIGDAVESVIIGAIKDKDRDMAKWYATKKLRSRGYGDSSEVKHSGEVTVTNKGYVNVSPSTWNKDKDNSPV